MKSSSRKRLPLSLHQHVVDELGGRIVRGEFGPDAVLPVEDSLAGQFGVSRTVVREAIKVLVHKGLLEVRTRTGTRALPSAAWNNLDPDILRWRFASGLDARFLSDVTELRQMVEPAAAELAAARATPAALRAIEDALHEMMTAVEVDTHIASDLHFHSCILEAAGNELLLGLRHGMEGTWNSAIRLLSTQSKKDRVRALALHKAVADAIVAGKPEAARAAMHDLVDRWATDSLRLVNRTHAAKTRAKTARRPSPKKASAA
jgi:GntR family transcriptional regulator, galactonate operon transcriptional repressor